jgi:hypothetical protein
MWPWRQKKKEKKKAKPQVSSSNPVHFMISSKSERRRDWLRETIA